MAARAPATSPRTIRPDSIGIGASGRGYVADRVDPNAIAGRPATPTGDPIQFVINGVFSEPASLIGAIGQISNIVEVVPPSESPLRRQRLIWSRDSSRNRARKGVESCCESPFPKVFLRSPFRIKPVTLMLLVACAC